MAYADNTTGGRTILEGMFPISVVLSAAVKAGDLLGVSASTWVQADGDNTVYAELIAGKAGASGDTITAYRTAVVGGVTGGTKGAVVYLSDTVGGYSDSAGTVGQVVGVQLTATEMLIAPQYDFGGQLIPGAVKMFFRDSGLFINSGADGKLTISADGSSTDDITLAGTVTVSDDLVMASGKDIGMSGASTFATGTGAVTLNGTPTVVTGKVLTVTDADGITVAGIKVPQRVVVTTNLAGAAAATAANYGVFFIADRAYKILSVKERHRTLGTDGGAVTLTVEKVPSGTAEGAGSAVASDTINLKATVNTNQSLTLNTDGTEILAAGDALALTDSGTLTAVADVTVTVEMQAN